MARTTIAITLDDTTLARIDELVNQRVYPNRSRAIQSALQEKLESPRHARLAQECAKLDPEEEQALAEVGFAEDMKLWQDL